VHIIAIGGACLADRHENKPNGNERAKDTLALK
jgi:hypothetical protein